MPTKQVGRQLTGGKAPDVRKAYQSARAETLEIARLLDEAEKREKELLLAAEEEERTRKKRDGHRRVAFENYFDLDPDLVLARRYLRKVAVSVETQVTEKELKEYEEKAKEELAAKLRARLEGHQTRAELLLKTVSEDPAEAAREYKRKRYDVRACYEHYAEKSQKTRKELREKCGTKEGVTRKTKPRSKEELAEIYARRKALAEGRENGTLPAAIPRAKRGEKAVVKEKRPVSPNPRGREETTPDPLRLPEPTPGFFNVAGELPSPASHTEAPTLEHEQTPAHEEENETEEEPVNFEAIAQWYGVEP